MAPSTTPSGEEFLFLGSGRILCFQRFGQRDGKPAYFFHGFPGSRLHAALVHEQALAAGLCLVAFDRAGFGQSEHDPDRTFESVAWDFLALADHLGHARVPLIGVSCGGAWALACARQFPERVSRVGLFAGMGPMDIPSIRKGQFLYLKWMFALARISPALLAPVMALDWLMYRIDPKGMLDMVIPMLSPPDQALLRNDIRSASLLAWSLAETYRHGIRGSLREAVIFGATWPHDLTAITTPVQVYQAAQDQFVPPAMGRYLAETLPNAMLEMCGNEGHLSVFMSHFPAFARLILNDTP